MNLQNEDCSRERGATNNMATRKRIVLTTIGSLGDLHPMMALALELRRQGHDAIVATTEYYRRKIEETGLGFHPIRPSRSPEDPELMRHVMDLKTGPEFIIRNLFMPHLREMYDDLLAAAASADLMLAGEIVFAAPLVAEKLGLKWAAVILSPASFFSAHDPSVIAPLPFTKHLRGAPLFVNHAVIKLGRFIARNWGAPVNELRAELGLRRTAQPLFVDKFSPHLNLAMFSQVLGTLQPDWPAHTVQTGFVFYDQDQHGAAPAPGPQVFLDAGEPPIVFTLGSAAVFSAGGFYEESERAARTLGRRALLLIGKNAPPPGLSDEIKAFDYAPYSEMLPRAACVVHQGGVGTTAQALRAGRPQLIVPYSFDQPDNAARVERLGVARVIARNAYTADRAATELRRLLDKQHYGERGAQVAESVRAEDGLRVACDAINRLLD